MMNRIIINPTDRNHWLTEKTLVVSSTEQPTLVGCSAYGDSPFQLYWRKKNREIQEIEETERMEIGSILEPALLNLVSKRLGAKVIPKKEFIKLPNRMGSSFDGVIVDDGGKEVCLVECKNSDKYQYEEKYIENDDGSIEAPAHIEIQAQVEMYVSGIHKLKLCVLIGGSRLVIIDRELDHNVINIILKKNDEFWRRIDNDDPPPVDYKVDSEFLIALNQSAVKGRVADVSQSQEVAELVSRYKSLSDSSKLIDEQKTEIKARLMEMIGDAEKAIGNGFSISMGTVAECPMNYVRSAYRQFRINFKKEKK